jgi:hypothetical protein
MDSYDDKYHYYVKSGICFSEDGAADTPHRLSEHLKVDWLLLD